ncbi:hypothetical protein [Pseudomonas graminis]|uniref:hypothetical protein n=1 Tax=Pseudomonas graminis TaxID=158627 RepID=UPI0015875C11|nr:hypothetical protein [Pseudomonas graminis]
MKIFECDQLRAQSGHLLFDFGIKHLPLLGYAHLNVGVHMPKLSPVVRIFIDQAGRKGGRWQGILDKKKPAMGGAGLKSVLEEQVKTTAPDVKNL